MKENEKEKTGGAAGAAAKAAEKVAEAFGRKKKPEDAPAEEKAETIEEPTAEDLKKQVEFLTKQAAVAEAKAKVEKFLNEKLTLDVQEGDTVRQFVTKTLDPLENLDNFKICLTRLWFNTDVLVEWSMPPGMTENL